MAPRGVRAVTHSPVPRDTGFLPSSRWGRIGAMSEARSQKRRGAVTLFFESRRFRWVLILLVVLPNLCLRPLGSGIGGRRAQNM